MNAIGIQFHSAQHQNRLASLLLLLTFLASFSPAASIGVVNPPQSEEAVETSFEELPAGTFNQVQTQVGTWTKPLGQVLIDNKHARSGNQCLQIAGGERASVELILTKSVLPDGQLTFWAERWTSRAPFQFRIEKYSNSKWTEIYNGDKSVRVGRAFRSHVKVPLGDKEMTRLRFTATSPANTGVLIDDLRIAPASPQKITSVEIVPFTLPALVGTKASALVKLNIKTQGSLAPLSLTRLTASLSNEASCNSLEHIHVAFSGMQPGFQPKALFADPHQAPTTLRHTFSGDQVLSEGDNYFWLIGKVNDNADIDQAITSQIESITLSNGATHTFSDKPSIQRPGVSVRNSGDDGVHTYRIPGLATTNKGTLIGVYDVRRDRGGDLPGNIDVGMSRSTDGGRTWEPMRVIMDMGSDPKWRGDGIGDPAVLVDRKTGTIWVSATWSHGNRAWHGSGPGLTPKETGQWILVKSEDDGRTWSDPINITRQVKNPEWSFLLQGPGKGITMSDGTLVFPAQYQDPPNPKDKRAHRLPHSTLIYSRDHGKTWQTGTGAWDDTTEAQLVELNDGQLMINCRNNRSSKRAVMTTTDMGTTWQKHATHVRDLIEPGSCMASLLNVRRELSWRNFNTDSSKDVLLFSNPDSLRGRNHMTIKASLDEGMSWPVKHHLLLDEQNGFGYSCMSMIDSDTVGILYEGSQAHMTFQRVKLAEILSPPKNQKTKNPAVATVQRPSSPKGVLQFARPFGHHMVLQADQPIRVWGTAKPGSQVNVGFQGSSVTESAVATPRGHWIIELPAQPTCKTPQTLVASTPESTITINDLLIGEVWICAGQSNMEWTLRQSDHGTDAVASSTDPLLRLHNCSAVARGAGGIYSAENARHLWPDSFSRGQWRVSSPTSSAHFSAVGYAFARQLREQLDVPVGIINVAVGGTPIESWVSARKLMAHPELHKLFNGNWLDNPVLDEWCRSRARMNLSDGLAGKFVVPEDEFGPNHSFKPAFMFEAGIKPFTPLSIRGALWYQGESNANNAERARIYDACFPQLVDDWRARFQNKSMPIVFVQLPAMGRPNWPLFRELQRRSLQKLNQVGMAITIDTGHPTNVHPGEKKTVGDRLAQWALVRIYGQPGTESGPLLTKHRPGKPGTIQVEFQHVGSGLTTIDGKPPRHFEVAGNNKQFVPATARILGTHHVEVSSQRVAKPKYVRYAWSPFPSPGVNLTNSDHTPASPFTTQSREAILR